MELETELGLLMKEIKKNLESVMQNHDGRIPNIDYAVICNCAIKLLDKIFGETYTMPIDIHLIYEKLGISVIETDLNSYMEECNPRRVNKITGKISIRKSVLNNSVIKKSIYIDENTAPIQQRFAMAHELCHYILKMDDKMYSDEFCNMPMLPKNSAELVADAFAIFLLIPLNPFLKEFLKYVENERKSERPPFKTSEWFEYLSAVSYVAEDYVAYGYQEIRYVANWLYELKQRKEAGENVEENKEGVEVLLSKMDTYLTDDIIKGLFI